MVNVPLLRLYSCLLCDAPATQLPLCPDCRADLPWNHQACQRCALPSPAPLCAQCSRQAPRQAHALAPLRYDFPVDHMVSGLKYHGRLDHARLLGVLLRDAVLDAGRPRPDLLLPVPLHPQRLAERGYNQAAEIARPLARHFELPLEHELLLRTRDTLPQMQLDAAARARNPQQAFRLNPVRLARRLPVQRVAVIDDVMTTGATLVEICRVLQAAGIPHIEFWVVARTP